MLRRWNDLRLRTRLMLSMVLISALLTGGALLLVQSRVHGQLDEQIDQQVQNSLATFQQYQARSEGLAASTAALVATVPSLEAAMSTDDPRTIQDPLNDIAAMLPPGAMLVLADARGRLVGQIPAQGGLSAARASTLLSSSLGLRSTWWYGDGHLYEVFLRPVYRGAPSPENQVGTLALGQELDRALAGQISRLAAGQVVFSLSGQPVVSSLQPDQEMDFARAHLSDATGLRSTVRLGVTSYAVDTERLAGAGAVPTLTVLRSTAPIDAFLKALNRLILLVGIAALIIGALLVFLIARAFTQPLAALIGGARALERGDFRVPLARGGRDEAGELTAAFARMRDTLDQNQQDLLRAARMEAIGQLAGGVAHDFNNLITVIGGFSDFMLAKIKPEDPNRPYLEQIKKAGARAAGLTRQLLVFSRKDSAQLQPVEVNPVMAGMNKMLAVLVGEDIELVLKPGLGTGTVTLDPTHLEQMIMNFAANARDAMPRGGTLTLVTRNLELAAPDSHLPRVAPGRYLELSVRDTGTGMDAETQKHIFEPFYTTKEVGKGTGLGLATIYGIVQRSGGHIFVESAPGQGTCFRVLLPALAAPQAAAEGRSAAAPPAGSETVLLVEDEEGLRAMLREALETAGYQVLVAGDGIEALALAHQHREPIDLVLTDVVMPRMGGGELISELRKLRPRIAVIYTSGYTDKALSNYGIDESQVHFVPKPFAPDDLTRKVHAVLHPGAAAAGHAGF